MYFNSYYIVTGISSRLYIFGFMYSRLWSGKIYKYCCLNTYVCVMLNVTRPEKLFLSTHIHINYDTYLLFCMGYNYNAKPVHFWIPYGMLQHNNYVTGHAKIRHICTQNLSLFLNFNVQYLLKYKCYYNAIFIPYLQINKKTKKAYRT